MQPFSYLSVVVAPNDDKQHDVQVYTDISGQWTSGDPAAPLKWNTATANKIVTHSLELAEQDPYQTHIEMIKQGAAYYSAFNSSGLTWRSGEDAVVRQDWIAKGKLPNEKDNQFRSYSDRWPVFAFSLNLGALKAASKPTVFSVGHVR